MTTVTGDVIKYNGNFGKGAVELARNMYTDSSNKDVVSTLCYGVQWDAAMQFMEDTTFLYELGADRIEYRYIENSTGRGWYSDNYSLGNVNHKTGIDVDDNKSNMVKNIYDMISKIILYLCKIKASNILIVLLAFSYILK